MNRSRKLALAMILAAGIAGAAIPFLPRKAVPRARPQLALLTSLPLMFGERFGLEGGGSPALRRIERDYAVRSIAVADAASLNGQRLLLMAHPRAQPAEVLVELDRWVRQGGHVLLLADPRLDWPSERPLGDPLRPPPWFADTGLLGHWGLRLDAPGREGAATVTVAGKRIAVSSAGRLARTGRGCSVEDMGFIARCRIGRGRAVVIADADFLNVTDHDGGANLDLLARELSRLATR